ncbi:MAG: hypothetical protein J0I80_05215 [Sphingomonas sp.]|nr:hypothetical protein [Sphingomonas sp.]
MKYTSTGLVTACLATMIAFPAQAQAVKAGDEMVDKQISGFFDTLKQGDADGAIAAVMNSSPLWANRTGAKEQMVAQVEAATKIYGPLVSFDCLPTLHTGSLISRKYCFAQHQLMVVRWQFDFARLPTGWSVAYFGFTDQANNWPDGD